MRLSLMNRKLIAHRACAGHCLNVPSFFCGAVFIAMDLYMLCLVNMK